MSKAALFTRMISLIFTLLCGLAATSSAYAISGIGMELGHGVASTEAARFSLRWDWRKYWNVGDQWNASGFWETGLGYMDSEGISQKNTWQVGFAPVIRLRSGVSPFFFEGGIGAHWLSNDRLNLYRELGSNLQFSEILGFGWNVGNKDHYELGYRFTRYSNANLAEPNDGINLHLFRLGYNY
jgi:hypothetical protein